MQHLVLFEVLVSILETQDADGDLANAQSVYNRRIFSNSVYRGFRGNTVGV